jgi:hypothetical protein
MKIKILIRWVMLALMAPRAFAAEYGHSGHGMNYLGNKPPAMAHQEVVDGVKVTVDMTPLPAAASNGTATHRMSVAFNEMKTGTALTRGEVTISILGPYRSEQTRELPPRHGLFSTDFALAKQGTYGVMCWFTLADGLARSSQFRYEVK